MENKIEILFEDASLLVINKPAGMVVNRAESVVGDTVQEYLDTRYKIQDTRYKQTTAETQIFKQRSGIAHRLDKETSGCLVIAKDPSGLAELMRQFKDREIKKTYLALVHGRVEPKEGWWYWPIKRGVKEKREEFRVVADGRLALTDYKVIERMNGLTYLECYPKTGRTHQIRVHAAFAGHPLVGDSKYGANKTWKEDLKWCPRHFLHAAKISFSHPVTRQKLTVAGSLPNDLQAALEKVRLNA